MNAAIRYRDRFRRVLAYVDAHLDEPLSVERLSAVAAFSPHHFHRQFAALFGVGVHRYVQLLRLRRAAYRLAFRPQQRITGIALDSGYGNAESFSRAFRTAVGQTPSAFREQPRWDAWHAVYDPMTEPRTVHMTTEYRPEHVALVDCAPIRVAALRHCGDPRTIGDSVRRFIDWRRQHALPPSRSATYNILHDDPADTSPEDYRIDICAATEHAIEPNAHGVVAQTIPGGRCAVLRHVGDDDGLAAAMTWLYREWLPASGETPRDFPPYLQRVKVFPDVPAHEAVTVLFLPIE